MKLALYLTLLFTNKPIVTNHRDLILVKNNKELKQELELIWRDEKNKPKIILIKSKHIIF